MRITQAPSTVESGYDGVPRPRVGRPSAVSPAGGPTRSASCRAAYRPGGHGVPAALAEHDAEHVGDPAAARPASAEHQAPAGGVVRAGLGADEAVVTQQRVGVVDAAGDRQRRRRPCHQQAERRPERVVGGEPRGQPQLVGRRSTPSRGRSRSGRCSASAPCPAGARCAFIRATNSATLPAVQRASRSATLLADGSSSASSACRSVSRSPAATAHHRLAAARRRW